MSKKEENFRYDEDESRTLTEDILDFIKTFIICSLVIFIVGFFVIRPSSISGSSMYPTLKNGQRGVSNVFGYMLHGVDRGDIVLLSIEEDGQKHNIIKRVIGLPNETISCKDDVIYINGEPLDEAYLDTDHIQEWKRNNSFFTPNFDAITLGEDEYYVLGDNRPISQDSTEIGPIKKSQIFAKDFLVLLPFRDFQYLN